jgi:hypothetical protein
VHLLLPRSRFRGLSSAGEIPDPLRSKGQRVANGAASNLCLGSSWQALETGVRKDKVDSGTSLARMPLARLGEGWKMRSLSIITTAAFAALGSAALAQENLSEVEFRPQFIRIHENGGFLGKTWSQLNTPEFKGAVGVACAALGCAPLVTTILANVGKIPIARAGITRRVGTSTCRWVNSGGYPFRRLRVTLPAARRTTVRPFQRIRATQLAVRYSVVQKETGSVLITKYLRIDRRGIGCQSTLSSNM